MTCEGSFALRGLGAGSCPVDAFGLPVSREASFALRDLAVEDSGMDSFDVDVELETFAALDLVIGGMM